MSPTVATTAEHQPRLPCVVRLQDGTRVRLRIGTPADREVLVAGFEELSTESRVTRFFTAMPRLTPRTLDWLMDVDGTHRVAVAAFDLDRPATVGDPRDGHGIGVARYYRDRGDPSCAEVAVAVIDEYHGRGVARILLGALAGEALQNGISTFTATVLQRNIAMLRVLDAMEATSVPDPDDRSVLRSTIPLDRGDSRPMVADFGLTDRSR